MKKLTFKGYIKLSKEPVPQVCEVCGIETYCVVHHVFNGTANRRISHMYGLVALLCVRCHDIVHEDARLRKRLKAKYQKMFIKFFGEELFFKLFGENFIE